MAKITKEDIEKFIQNNEIQLISTHGRLSLPIINRIYKKMLAGIKFSAIKIHDNFICDGHHRYIASLLANYNIEAIIWVANTTITLTDWSTVSFDESDWDTEHEINS